ncbi:MAG: serine hydrolase domain-containing protein, partial [bacterium]
MWDEFTIFATSTNHSYPDETDPEEALAAVDAICQAKADGAGLVGTFRAWLSRDGLTASDRLLHANVPYVRTDGVQVADNWADLTDETLDAAISLDQNQDPVSGLAWTGTRSNGSLFGFQSCEPPAPPNSGLGRVGSVLATSVSEWTSLEARDCNESHHFYCIEHPAAPNLAPREMWTGIWENAGSDQTIPYDGRIVRRSWPLAEFEAALPGLEAVGWRIRDVEVRWTGYLLFVPGELVADVILERGNEDEEFFEGSWEGFLVRHQAAQSEGRLLIDFEYVGLSNPAAAPNSVAAVWRGLGAYLIHDPLDWDTFMDRRDQWADSSYQLVDLEIRNDFGTSGESLFVGVYHYNFFAVPNYLLVGPEWDEFASLAMQLDDFKLVDVEVFEVWGEAASGEAIPHYAGVWRGTSDRDRFIGGQPWDRWVRTDELYRDLRLVPIDLDSHQGIPKAPPAFAGYLHDVLGPQSVGYSYGFTENGGETYGASGYARAPWEVVDPAIRMTPGKRMELASVAKSITGAAVLQAASEAGIAATVDQYLDLPFWAQIAPFFDSGMASTVDAGVASVSIRDVLRHRSGIGFGGGGAIEAVGTRCNDIINKLEPFLEQSLVRMPGLPFSPPGGSFVYQNYNYCIAHLLVEASSQWPHAAWVQDRLFRSVGIYGARNKLEESAPTLAYMLRVSAPGAPITNPGFTYTHDAVDEVGPNGWYMSAADLLRFYLAFDAADNVTAEVRNEAWSDVQGWFPGLRGTSRNFVGHNGMWGNTGRYTTAGLRFRVGQVGTLLVNSAPSDPNNGPPGWSLADFALARAF